jgi:DNA-binding SARP family transcriptional activator
VARRILQLDPCHEQAHRLLIRLFADAGKPSAALAQYDTYRHALGAGRDPPPDGVARLTPTSAEINPDGCRRSD